MIRNIFLAGLVFLVSVVIIEKTLLTSLPQSVATLEPVIVAPEPPLPKPIDINEMHCLATNIYHEARGESIAGKVAVGNVTLNRVNHIQYPDTICAVVYQAHLRLNWRGKLVPRLHKCQFSWYCDGKSDVIYLKTSNGKIIKHNMEAWEQSLNVATTILKNEMYDPTFGATHYYNDKLADPSWADAYMLVARIDNHVFHRQGSTF
jgi:spore germination cell wall hydrolase CwlJ-like protein